MLIFGRKVGQKVIIGDMTTLTILSKEKDKINVNLRKKDLSWSHDFTICKDEFVTTSIGYGIVEIRFLEVNKRGLVQLGFKAPSDIEIHREEVFKQLEYERIKNG